jgi:hypothetical protein
VSKLIGHGPLLGLELGEGEQEPLNVDEIRTRLGAAGAADLAHHLHPDELDRCDHLDLAEAL